MVWHQIKALSVAYQFLKSWWSFLVMYLLVFFCVCFLFLFYFSSVYLDFSYLLASPFNISTSSKKKNKKRRRKEMEFHEYNMIHYVITNFNGVKSKKTIPSYTILCPKIRRQRMAWPSDYIAVWFGTSFSWANPNKTILLIIF